MTRALAAEDDDAERAGWLVASVLGGLPLLVASSALGIVLALRADAPTSLIVVVILGLTIDAYYFALLRGLRRFTLLTVYRVGANLAQILVLVALAASGTATLASVVVLYGLVYLVPIVVIEIAAGPGRRLARASVRGVRNRLPGLTRFAIPALVSGTAYGAVLGFDVFFVRLFAPEALADYAAARSLAVPMLLVPFALGVVLLPRAAASDVDRPGQARLLVRAVAITLAAAGGAWVGYLLLGGAVIDLVFPPSYADARAPLMTLVPAIGLVGTYSILSQWTLGVGRPWTAAVALGVGALVTLAGHAVATAQLGAPGAGLAIAAGAMTAIVVNALDTVRWLRSPATGAGAS
jgi:O-antigen/teichoic acid export membrane protein